MSDWPTHPDGRPMKMGELPRETQRAIMREAVARVAADLQRPAVQAAIAKVFADTADEAARAAYDRVIAQGALAGPDQYHVPAGAQLFKFTVQDFAADPTLLPFLEEAKLLRADLADLAARNSNVAAEITEAYLQTYPAVAARLEPYRHKPLGYQQVRTGREFVPPGGTVHSVVAYVPPRVGEDLVTPPACHLYSFTHADLVDRPILTDFLRERFQVSSDILEVLARGGEFTAEITLKYLGEHPRFAEMIEPYRFKGEPAGGGALPMSDAVPGPGIGYAADRSYGDEGLRRTS